MPVLQALRHWFGIESANEAYEADIDQLPTFVAHSGEQVVGFVSVKHHFPASAELYVLGVRPERHRQGIGRRMLYQVEAWLREQGVEYLQVKTRGPSQPDEGYERTRAFYRALGYQPLEEMLTLWDESNPALLMVKRL